MSADGRPFAPSRPELSPIDPPLWWPDPQRDGDPVYCGGARVGTYRVCQSWPGWFVQALPLGRSEAASVRRCQELVQKRFDRLPGPEATASARERRDDYYRMLYPR